MGWIGVSTKSASNGAVVTALVPDGPAAKAGIRVGDIIQGLNGTIVKNKNFDAEIAAFKPGTSIVVSFMRAAWAHEALITVARSPM